MDCATANALITHRCLPNNLTLHKLGKRISQCYCAMRTCREKLLRRLEVLKSLKHPNIMQFMDYWVTEGEAREDGTRRVQITFITEVSTSGT